MLYLWYEQIRIMSTTVKRIAYKSHGQRLEELLRSKWETQGEAALALGVAQGSISNWINLEKLPDRFFERYAERFRENGLNLAFVKNPLAPKTPPAVPVDPFVEFTTSLEILKAQVEALEGAARKIRNPEAGPSASPVV